MIIILCVTLRALLELMEQNNHNLFLLVKSPGRKSRVDHPLGRFNTWTCVCTLLYFFNVNLKMVYAPYLITVRFMKKLWKYKY